MLPTQVIAHFEGLVEQNKYYIRTYGLKSIFFTKMGYFEPQRYDKKSILYVTRLFSDIYPQKVSGHLNWLGIIVTNASQV